MSSPILENGNTSHHPNSPVLSSDPPLITPRHKRAGFNNQRTKAPPPITPKSFKKFFKNHRISLGQTESSSRQALRDITQGASSTIPDNQSCSGRDSGFTDIDANTILATPRHCRKRKALPTPESTPSRFQSSKKARLGPPIFEDEACKSPSFFETLTDGGRMDAAEPLADTKPVFPQPIKRCSAISRMALEDSDGWNSLRECPAARINTGWQDHTADFYSQATDVHSLQDQEAPDTEVQPFCTTSCHKTSMVAVGDQEGFVRLIDTAKEKRSSFHKSFIEFSPHSNAIVDMEFSSDDLLLATAAGDQTGAIIDVETQKTITILKGHSICLKQARFQPGLGGNNVLATSSRDGSVQIWDLRCTGVEKPAREFLVSLDTSATRHTKSGQGVPKLSWARAVNSIFDAHMDRRQSALHASKSTKLSNTLDISTKADTSSRRGLISVTALTFLPPGRENLLLTGSEANASVKVWDLRTTYQNRRGQSAPLSTTRQPESHEKHRAFGINSLAVSGDGARFYSLCRDNTVYAYSTSHLILGQAFDLSSASRPRRGRDDLEGMGPLYGFRHPNLQVSSFYVKSSLRAAFGDKCEMLAVGSGNECAIIFPTEERYFEGQTHCNSTEPLSTETGMPKRGRRRVQSSSGNNGISSRLVDTIPIYQYGSALIRGHQKEVSDLTWTLGGDLVSLGDDSTARCWRQGPEARELRLGGEEEGKRWGCGWAEVEEGYDDV
ncbi:MAG: hypothetical protein M1829_006077 [Trizodia sp. TS-e1964]|nr:MAG: hypothetical protein M1829_006077 [Trizodia sp. TS-e1964]